MDSNQNVRNDPERRNKIWQKNNCISCHSLYGLGGHLGPDLTNVISRRNAEYVKYIVKNGKDGMLSFNISDSDLELLIKYLEFVNQSGTYPLQKKPIPIFGDLN